eukprot:scaffold25917_cov121-Isochrysis_galbana.AAC.3
MKTKLLARTPLAVCAHALSRARLFRTMHYRAGSDDPETLRSMLREQTDRQTGEEMMVPSPSPGREPGKTAAR